MLISPESINDTLFVNENISYPMQIFNMQHFNSILNFSVSLDTTINWISVIPESGIVGQMDSLMVTLNINATGLTSGSYFTYIVFTGNDTINSIDTISVNIEIISAPALTVSDSILIGYVAEDQIDSTYFWIYNHGGNDLQFSIKESDTALYSLNKSKLDIKSFGDTLGTLNVEAITGISGNRGVGFDGEYIWISTHDNVNGNKLFKIDFNGNLIAQYPQGTSSVWGMGDITFDGTYLYAGDTDGFYQIDPQTGSVTNLGSFSNVRAIVNNDIRALDYDPTFDNFWVANQNSPICVFDRGDNIITTFPNNMNGITGMAWDSWDNWSPYLWIFSMQYPTFLEVIQFSVTTGMLTGKQFTGYMGNNGMAGSCTIIPDAYIDGTAVFAALQYEATDKVYFYDIEVETGLSWLDVVPAESIVSGNDSIEIKVYFYGKYLGNKNGYLNIISNDPLNPIHNIYILLETVTDIGNNDSNFPKDYFLHQNYPNPFNPATTIRYDLKENTNVNISIYNILGEKIRTF